MSTLKVNDIVDTGGHSLLGRRNLIINGGFDVWQRGTSFSGLNNYAYCADRWQCASSTAVSRSTDVPSGEGFLYSGQFSGATANNNFVRMILEDSNRILGSKNFTLSFWIKGSTSSTGYVDVNDSQGQNFSITTSWTKVTKTFTPITAHVHGGTANDFFDIATDTVSTVYLTGVQLEVGSTATPFEHRSYGEELALCQRYYQISGNNTQNGFDGTVSVGMLTTGQIEKGVKYPVKLRAAPTLTFIDGAGNVGKVSRLYPGVAWNDNQTTNISNNSDTGHWSYSPSGNNGAALMYRWIADAEL